VLLLAAFVLGVATIPLGHGSLSKLAAARLKLVPAIFAAVALQIVIFSVLPDGTPLLHRALHLGSYALAAAFLVANRNVAGMAFIAMGTSLNVAAICANNGVMPASRVALRAAGNFTDAHGFANSAFLRHPRLLPLGDIFAIPKSWPLHNVYSVGDVCIAVGAIVVVHALSGSRLARRRRVNEELRA